MKHFIGILLLMILFFVIRQGFYLPKKKYIFKREYSGTASWLPLSLDCIGNTATPYKTFFLNGKLINYSTSGKNDTGRIKTPFVSFDLKNCTEISLNEFWIPSSASICGYTDTVCYYVFDFILYSVSNSKSIQKITNTNIKVLSATSIDRDCRYFLTFAHIKKNAGQTLGFYVLDSKTGNILHPRTLSDRMFNDHQVLRNQLIYSGFFTRNFENGTIAFYFDKISKILLFDKSGKFLREYSTKDNVPFPELNETPLGIFYKRGKTFNTNAGVFVRNDNLYTFSYRSIVKNKMVIDEYSMLRGKHLKSHKVKYKNKTCNDIMHTIDIGTGILVMFIDDAFLLKI